MVAGREINGEIAVMMVEAGGTEKAWDYYLVGGDDRRGITSA